MSDIIRSVRFTLPEYFCQLLDDQARQFIEARGLHPSKALLESYVKKVILGMIEEEFPRGEYDRVSRKIMQERYMRQGTSD